MNKMYATISLALLVIFVSVSDTKAQQNDIYIQPLAFQYNKHIYPNQIIPETQPADSLVETIKQLLPAFGLVSKQSYMFGKNTYRDVLITRVDTDQLVPVLVKTLAAQQQQLEKLQAALAEWKKLTAK